MIVDDTCSRCGVAHALPPERCPFDGRPPRWVARRPTVEEIPAHTPLDSEDRVSWEQAKLERRNIIKLVMLDEYRKQFHRQQVREIAAEDERLKGELSAVRERDDLQARARRLARNPRLKAGRRDG